MKKKGIILSCVALILVLIISFQTISINQLHPNVATRTISLNENNVDYQGYKIYLNNFDNYEINVTNDNNISFNGNINYCEENEEIFDYVAINNDINNDTPLSKFYDCSFDIDKMEFDFYSSETDSKENAVSQESSISPAFTDANGQLDACVIIDNES